MTIVKCGAGDLDTHVVGCGHAHDLTDWHDVGEGAYVGVAGEG